MAKANTQKPEKKASDDSNIVKIIEYIRKKGSVDFKTLKKEFVDNDIGLSMERQTLQRCLRILCNDNRIKPYIKMETTISQAAPKDNEIYFSVLIKRYKYPHQIERLIDNMCQHGKTKDDDVVHDAFNKFVDVYEKTAKCTTDQAKHTAYNLMAREMAGDTENYNFFKNEVVCRLFGLPTIKPLWSDQEHLSHPSL